MRTGGLGRAAMRATQRGKGYPSSAVIAADQFLSFRLMHGEYGGYPSDPVLQPKAAYGVRSNLLQLFRDESMLSWCTWTV
jgi:hypothetical protein